MEFFVMDFGMLQQQRLTITNHTLIPKCYTKYDQLIRLDHSEHYTQNTWSITNYYSWSRFVDIQKKKMSN